MPLSPSDKAQAEVVRTLMPLPDPKTSLGFPLTPLSEVETTTTEIREHISLLLASQGFLRLEDLAVSSGDASFRTFGSSADDLMRNYREKTRILEGTQTSPIATRIQNFINSEFKDTNITPLPRLPSKTVVLSKHGVARELSFPLGANEHENEYVKSYKIQNGSVLHNPRFDKRTTAGTFHIAEGAEDLVISSDKLAVPKDVFVRMLDIALHPPAQDSLLPFSAKPSPIGEVHAMVSLLLRPIVCPEIPGKSPVQTMEILCLAPGSLVSCLDFVESVFGNAGDPFLPENDAALDPEHWTGHTGLIVMAPHLNKVTKKELGLPRWEDATEKQREQGMCWKDESEKYHNGKPFKVLCRTKEGVILSLIADNYFGYCKKEVKTHLSYAANLNGMAQEEHSGGTLAFPQYSFGLSCDAQAEAAQWPHLSGYGFKDALKLIGEENYTLMPEGYAIDKHFPHIYYVPEDAYFSLASNAVTFTPNGPDSVPPKAAAGEADSESNKDSNDTEVKRDDSKKVTIRLNPDVTYMLPSGYRIQAVHHPAAPAWRLIGTDGRATVLHKPCTVSGGGKSELSKAIDGAMMYGPLFVNDPNEDFALVDEILNHDFSHRYKDTSRVDDRPLLSKKRSIGSVIKLLTPSDNYTDEYNAWVKHFPTYIFPIVYYVKRFWKKSWGNDWRSHFGMDLINGSNGHELKFENRKISAGFLRVGVDPDCDMWRTFKTRIDYIPCSKVQLEDDISASVTVPSSWLPEDHGNATHPPRDCQLPPDADKPPMSRTLAVNCEFRLFQRPDDCVKPGEDQQCESDMLEAGNFIANFEPKTADEIADIASDVSLLEKFTPPMKNFLLDTAEAAEMDPESVKGKWFVCSANTRLVNGKPSANPRYLQTRPDAVLAEKTYASQRSLRLFHRVASNEPLVTPVDVIMLGRRVSKPVAGLPNLACYNPLHYQEFPELFMDLMCCISGKSPSTTGAGSEGALTKGPFNALPFSADLNNLLVSYILTGLGGWSTPTGFIGPKKRFAHDITFLAPEVMSRMKVYERNPAYLEANGYLEHIDDFEYEGKKVEASRLGWRITQKFDNFLARVFDYPNVFEEDVLRPEKQDLAGFVDAVNGLVEVQKIIGTNYFKDGTYRMMCPPLRALLHIMVEGNYKGKTLADKEIRDMFTLDNMLKSKWYHDRLVCQQKRDIAAWTKKVEALEKFLSTPANEEPAELLGLHDKLAKAKETLKKVSDPAYPDTLIGTIGADPLCEIPEEF